MRLRRWTSFALVGVGLVLGLGTSPSGAEGDDPPPLACPAPRDVRGEQFVTSAACAACHAASEGSSALRDEDGRWIGPWDLWRSSMMANAARDPLYRAVVSIEAAATPSRSAEIQARCLRCHAPLASVELKQRGEFTPSLALLQEDGLRGQLALDGVACTACHQIRPDGLGTVESFNGGYVIGDGRTLYGPYEHPLTQPMQEAVGFTPAHGPQIQRAELCGTCHTQLNESYAADGTPTGTLYPEQATFLEWKNSDLGRAGRPSCQSCHMPQASQDGQPLTTAIARSATGGDLDGVGEREPFGRHVFVGGNTLVPAILRDNPELIPTNASREAFDATIAAAREQLQRRSALVYVAGLTLEENVLEVPVRVENQTGHKLPTGHPTRRMWLHVRVIDGEGRRVFDSGSHDQRGRIVDGSGRALASELAGGPLEPHRSVVESEDQVLVYEAVAHDPTGATTFLLTRATGHKKDNRLLPQGWSFDAPDPHRTLPQGLGGDANFLPGADALVYRVDVGNRPGPFTVQVELQFQTLGARYAAELFEHRTPEMQAFRELYQAADRTPVTLARATARLESR